MLHLDGGSQAVFGVGELHHPGINKAERSTRRKNENRRANRSHTKEIVTIFTYGGKQK
ncbi:MAG: hypothetical protein PVG14_06225 [Anaerolineales bacterium]|jgi:hypothetical protein